MPFDGNIVKLNVGGTIFQTRKSTLTKFDGMLKAMMETEIPVTKDDSGAIFIDRDPTHFRRILNFLRDGFIELPESIEIVKEIQQEAQYYLLEGLFNLCHSKLESSVETMKLNVGGQIFETTRATLTKIDGLFRRMLLSEIPMPKDDSGAIFIDRSPKQFDWILSFLRWNFFWIHFQLPSSITELTEIKNEAQFYRLDKLRLLCVQNIEKEEMNRCPLFCDENINPYKY